MNPLTRRIAIALVTVALPAAVPALAPVAPFVGTVLEVSPRVRELLGKLRSIDIPDQYRSRNWTGPRGQGSCVHASLAHLLHWQGQHELAQWWRGRFGDGETAEGLAQKMAAAGITWAETREADLSFLEWCIRTRRGAAVVVNGGAHMVNLVGLDATHAHILDSNFPNQIRTLARDEFLRDWTLSGGWAVTPVGTPPAPAPWIVRSTR